MRVSISSANKDYFSIHKVFELYNFAKKIILSSNPKRNDSALVPIRNDSALVPIRNDSALVPIRNDSALVPIQNAGMKNPRK
jgi:hypothetical protein